MEDVVLSLKNISKYFPGVKALDDVGFDLKKGEILALIGENGAGKSTLIKCLTGAYQPTSGTIEVFGKEYSELDPRLAKEHGIGAVYQEFNLIPDLPIVENVFIGNNPGNGVFVDYNQMLQRCKETFERFDLNINPKANVSTLSPAMMQIVEIAKAVTLNCKILILDEPTAPLTPKETAILFRILNELRKEGTSIIYISHRLEEIFEICDRIVILRDGKCVGERKVSETTRAELIKLMIGRELTSYYPERTGKPSDEVVFEAKDISGNGDRDVSFKAYKGEVLGLAGLVGAGRTELMEVLFCDVEKEGGSVFINGEEFIGHSPKDAIKNGISYLPEDRKRRGLILNRSIAFNVSLAAIRAFSKYGFVNEKKESETVNQFRDQLKIKTPSLKQEVQFLSGGNQQKVIVAKWLTSGGQIILFDEPTRGIDVGSKHEIYEIIVDLADKGHTIIMVSSEFEELIGVADRIVVMSEGHIAGEMTRNEFDKEKLLDIASGNR